jgi:enoyl-CoA hydratase
VFGVFCRRWGVPLIDGGTVRLPRMVGQGRALDLILTGRPVTADEALAMGLANRVVPDGQALAAALELAGQIAGFPQRCMNADRASALAQWDWPLAEALRREGRDGQAVVFEEGLAGAARFARRRAAWGCGVDDTVTRSTSPAGRTRWAILGPPPRHPAKGHAPWV